MNTSIISTSQAVQNATGQYDVITESAADRAQAASLAIASSWLWMIFAPLLLLVGVVGNVFNLIVLLKLRCQKNPTLLLLAVLALTDISVLLVGLPRYFIREATDYAVDIRTLSGFSCKFSLFLIYFSMQLSSWILVLVSIIRLIKTAPYRFMKLRVSMRRAMMSLLVITLILVAINLHFFFTNGVVDGDCTSLTSAIYEFEEKVFVYIDFLFLSIFPALILIVCNVCIYRTVKRLGQRRTSVTRIDKSTRHSVSKVTYMLLFTSSYFIVANLPISVYFIFDSYVKAGDHQTLLESQKDMAWTIFYLFQFSHFASNFYFYTATNKSFRRELKKVILKMKKIIANGSPVESHDTSNSNKKVSNTNSS